jgi:glycosyltransferase involved in cell wall biosynthesis
LKANTIFFDARYIRVDHHDGISRFSAGLFEALSRRVNVVAIISDERQLAKLPPCEHVVVPAPTSVLEPLAALKLNRYKPQVVFSPMQTMGTLGRKYKLILTLHDLIYYRHPAPPPSFSLPIRVLWRLYHLFYWPQRLLLNRADAVATVSETTKRLIKQHKLTRRPVSVVYNAAEKAPRPLAMPSAPKSRKLLYMGSFMDYKNVETLIRAMKFLPDFELVLLSRISPERKSQLQQLVGASNVTFANGVSETEYLDHIDSAFALVSASRDEGFGIPLVEAMSRAIPVVVSDIEIFREIGGAAAIYFEPNAAEALAERVIALNNQDSWSAASKSALIQASKFSWDSSAESLLKMIEKL